MEFYGILDSRGSFYAFIRNIEGVNKRLGAIRGKK